MYQAHTNYTLKLPIFVLYRKYFLLQTCS